jgi:hypothetical protein
MLLEKLKKQKDFPGTDFDLWPPSWPSSPGQGKGWRAVYVALFDSNTLIVVVWGFNDISIKLNWGQKQI